MEFLNYLGKFHPVILHLPIGALYLTFCLALLEKFFKSKYTIPIRFGLLFSFVFALISALLGFFLTLGDNFSGQIVDIHMWLGISTALFIGLLLWIHKTTKYLAVFFPLFSFTVILLSVTGHFGGQITHGKDYLKLPDFSISSNTKIDSINLFSKAVKPIIDNKCVKCHNQNKSKGGLKLTTKNEILKGGDSGVIFTSFDPSSSHLYNYPRLPMDDKMHMPPEGNNQLSKDEIEILRIWIERGGLFDKTESLNSFSEKDQSFLIPLVQSDQINVEPPAIKDLENLVNLNFRVERNSASNNFIDVKFLGDVLTSKHMNALRSVNDQLIKLDLSNTSLDDNLISKLKNLKTLKYLKVNDTKLTDKGLAYLSPSLESLILNNNKVSFSGVVKLLNQVKLKNIYLWKTPLSSQDQQKLVESYSTNFNFGVKDFAKGVPLSNPIPISDQTLFADSLKFEFYKSVGDPEIRYTLNGTEPDSSSLIYTKPILIKSSVIIKAKAFKEGWLESNVSTIDLVKVEGILENYSLKTKPDNRYSHPQKLFDGVIGDTDFRSGNWNGFLSKENNTASVDHGDLILEVNDLDTKYSSIGFHALESLGAYIMFPEKIELYDISSENEKLIYSKAVSSSKIGAPI
ncbi:MAG: chitobiase/beta-hexosaminidase C-terminal domain-containing protein, partial [Flavobacteriaceae bacterium]|nr:chitobiase/beta-hexosaminidase C-terminal domain-containing protein [Flavobacteriaceae bacterium]